MSAAIAVIVVFWVIPVLVANSIGKSKHRAGIAYGILLGWIGVIILALLPPLTDPSLVACRFCRSPISPDASVCPHCQRELASAA